MNPLIQVKNATALCLVAFALACFGLSTTAQAVSPPPDGEYRGANTAEGNQALFSLSTGSNNTALGSAALFSVTTGVQNTAVGAQALKANTADGNTAVGFQALVKDTMGDGNTATGWRALFTNATGCDNTADGNRALYSNTMGSENTADGDGALFSNTTGSHNTANGFFALFGNTSGSFNTAYGFDALESNNKGIDNVAIGDGALNANTTGSRNIALGSGAGNGLTTGSDNIDLGNVGVAGENGSIRIGVEGTQTATFIAGISGETTGLTAVPVLVDANGQLGTTSSSRRFKNEIKPMDKTSEAILALKPVTFHYKSDTRGTPQFGLIAEEVAAVNPDLVVRDKNGEIYTVRYDAVNAMLLNEFLKEHRTVQELKSTAAKQEANAAKQEATIARQQKQIEALTTGLQKVSAQLEVSKPAPRAVLNDQ